MEQPTGGVTRQYESEKSSMLPTALEADFQALDAAIFDHLEWCRDANCLPDGTPVRFDFRRPERSSGSARYRIWEGEEDYHQFEESMVSGWIDIRALGGGWVHVTGYGVGEKYFRPLMGTRASEVVERTSVAPDTAGRTVVTSGPAIAPGASPAHDPNRPEENLVLVDLNKINLVFERDGFRAIEKSAPAGRPTKAVYDWAYKQVSAGRSFGDVYAELSENYNMDNLLDPRKSLKQAIRSRRGKKR